MPKKQMAWEKRMDDRAKQRAEEERKEQERRQQEIELRHQVLVRVGFVRKRKPKLPRTRVSDFLTRGRVQSWKGFFGWIRPAEPIEHEQKSKHQGDIYVEARDLIHSPKDDEGKLVLKVGSTCQFFIYSDENGLGAEEVIDVDLSTRMLEDERREEEERQRQWKLAEEEQQKHRQQQQQHQIRLQALQAMQVMAAQQLRVKSSQGAADQILHAAVPQAQAETTTSIGMGLSGQHTTPLAYPGWGASTTGGVEQLVAQAGSPADLHAQMPESSPSGQSGMLGAAAQEAQAQMDPASLVGMMQQWQSALPPVTDD